MRQAARAKRARLASALFCAACPFEVAAAQELSEREFLTEFPTVLSASRLRQDASETSQAVTVIDQEMIKASGVREVAELLRMVPGFTVSYTTRVKGLQPIVNYHGVGREFFSRLQVLIDGRSINNATLGGVDWSDFPLALEDIDHVEVIRGPSNATHGIGAFMATINFVTKHASQVRGFYTSANAGNDAILDGAARFGSGVDALDYRFTFGHRADDGFVDLNDHRARDYLNARSDWQLSAVDSLMFQVGGTGGINGVGSAQRPDDPERTARFKTAYAQIKWERNFDADNGLSLQYYYYRFSLTDRFLTDPIPEFNDERFPRDESSTVQRSDLELQQTGTFGPTLRWVWGGSLREDRAEVPAVISAPSRLRIERLFGHLEWRALDTVLVNAGAMLEHNSVTGTDVAPQVAVNYRLTPNQVLRFGLSKALRTPTPIEGAVQHVVVGPNFKADVASPSLQSETILSRELSYIGEWPALRATLDVKLFYDTLHDLIGLVGEQTFPGTAFPPFAANGDSARQRGIEGQFAWRPTPTHLFLLSGAYLDTDSDDRLDHYSTSAPRNIGHLLWSHRFSDQWNASVSVHGQSAFRAAGLSDPQRGFGRVDTRVTWQLRWGGGGEIGFVVENVFDNHYTEYRRENVAQRRVWATFNLKL